MFLSDKALGDRAKSKELFALKCEQGKKLECPCKSDEECGGGEVYCDQGTCDMDSPD